MRLHSSPYSSRFDLQFCARRFLLRDSWADEDTFENFGRLGCARSETDAESADRETLIRHLLRGEYSNPIRVVASEGWSRDVTMYIADELRRRYVEYDEVDFLEARRLAIIAEVLPECVPDLVRAEPGFVSSWPGPTWLLRYRGLYVRDP
jgi:hypothetical protein